MASTAPTAPVQPRPLQGSSAILRLPCILLFLLLAGATARADTLYLKGGDKIEGEVLQDNGDSYRVRTLIGVVDIEKDRIIKHVKGPAPWQVYAEKRKACANTAEAHYQLALWCRKHGLSAEETEQLEWVITGFQQTQACTKRMPAAPRHQPRGADGLQDSSRRRYAQNACLRHPAISP